MVIIRIMKTIILVYLLKIIKLIVLYKNDFVNLVEYIFLVLLKIRLFDKNKAM